MSVTLEEITLSAIPDFVAKARNVEAPRVVHAIGPEYTVELDVGALPSVVTKIVLPLVAHDTTTVADVVKVPETGETTGVATWARTVYATVSIALELKPDATASTLYVVVPTVLRTNEEVHGVEWMVGMLWSVVQ